MNKKRKISIRIKLLIALAASLALAAIIFYLVYQFGNFLVWRYYLGEANKQERAESYVEEFQDYVTKNMLSIDDTAAISGWNGGRYVDIIVYKDSNLIYAPDWFEDFRETDSEGAETSETAESLETDGETEPIAETSTAEASSSDAESICESDSESESETDKSFFENWFSGDRGFEQYLTEEARKNYRAALEDAIGENGSLHPVYFVDGTLIVAVVDFTEEMLGNIVIAAGIVCGLAVIAGIMIAFYGSIIKRIRLLQRNVRIIEEGDLDRDISQSGNDEISLLARDVGSMRDSIVDNMTRERRAWEANAGLITAMSHDIRTPLTVLLGYLDLIEMQNNGEISGEYIEACRENALRLKNLSDDMFSYFLVFGRSDSELNLVGVNMRMLTEHIVSEYSILLSEKGYKFKASGNLSDATVKIDERYFRRVIDNIFSNIIKYADIETDVELCAGCSDGKVTLSCKNKIRTDRDIPESNGIGLKTCMKMMEEMGGELKTEDSDGFFTVKISLPVEDENDRSDS